MLPVIVSIPVVPRCEPTRRQTYCDGTLASALAAMARAATVNLARCWFAERFLSRNLAILELTCHDNIGRPIILATSAPMLVSWRRSRSKLEERYPGLLRSAESFLDRHRNPRVSAWRN